jgi:hypothetical protein
MSTGALIRYDARLVEEAVLQAVRGLPQPEQNRFHSRREGLYLHEDPDEREAGFEALHGEWFVCLGLDRPLHRALAERPVVMSGVSECRVSPARSRHEEMADLLGREAAGVQPVLAVRLLPASLQDKEALLGLLRHEILHVADMLDPAFGYARHLPDSEEGPSYDNILRDRYRAVWATTIDGRLLGQGLCPETVREKRRRDFARSFGPLGDRADAGFESWFTKPHPTHAAIVKYIQDPGGAGGAAATALGGRCPLCRFPSALDPHPERLSPGALREIENDRPSWSPAQGLCAQCADLYLARAAELEPPEGARESRAQPAPQRG